MADDYHRESTTRETNNSISVVGPDMEIVGDIKCGGTVRIEGRVKGSIEAAKSVVIGKDGTVTGDITTREIVVAGSIKGTIVGESRIELQDTCRIKGNVHSPRIRLDEGGQVDGRLHMGHMHGDGQSATPPE
jgi:cytoskeletal protein CcmA (bactofilin family)